RRAPGARTVAEDARNGHDRRVALEPQVRRARLRDAERPLEVGPQDVVPLTPTDTLEGVPPIDARGRHRPREPPMPPGRLGDEPIDLVGTPDVRGDGERVGPGVAHESDGLAGSVEVVAAADHDARARAREFDGDGPTDPPGAARDQDGPV